MLAQSIRASRSSIARLARSQIVSKRTITVSAVRQADLVQDLYLKELKAYKPAAVKASDAEGSVLKFNPPKAPTSPEEADIAKELKAYEESTVEIEGQAEAGAAEVAEQDWFEEPEEVAHH